MRPLIIFGGLMPVLLCCALMPARVCAQEPELTEEVFFLPLETVITAGRTEQSIERAPATVAVISSEEIEASGALTIPELLRCVPGLDVMTISSSHSEVNARGLNQVLSNKLLVLIDGRSVYFDFFGGVIWQGLPILLNQIDRIEIVRSPGSALYGANAFSGVVNIITKSPRQLHGMGWKIQGGERSTLYTNFAQGDWKGDTGYRFALGTRKINSFRDADMASEDVVLGNVYLEHRFENDARLSAEVGLSRGSIVQVVRMDQNMFDATTTHAKMNFDYGALKLQAFWNRGDETGDPFFPPGDDVEILYDTFDLEAQHLLLLGVKHTFIYGGSYRYNTIESNIIDRYHDQNLFAAYFQDEYRPVLEVSLLAGARIDHHPLVGVNISPRGSFVYSPTGHHTFRLSVGKAFRNPTFTDSYSQVSTPFGLRVVGEPDLESEKITTYEMGYMYFPSHRLRAELDVFGYSFRDYIGPGEPKLVDSAPVQSFVNLGEAKSFGFEASADLIPVRCLKISANYSYQDMDNKYTVLRAQYPPEHKGNAKLFFTLPGGLSVSLLSSYVGETKWEIPTADGGYAEAVTDAHTRLDGKVGYLFENKRLEVFVTAYNLLDSRHKEFPLAEEIRRRAVAGLKVGF